MNTEYELRRDKNNTADCWLRENDCCPSHFHSSFELTYMLVGEKEITLNNDTFILSQGEFIVVPSYYLHKFTSLTSDSLSINFTVPLEFAPTFGLQCSKYNFTTLKGKATKGSPLVKNLLALQKLLDIKSDNLILIKGYTYAILGLLNDILGLSPINLQGEIELSKKILLYLEEHYLENITPNTLATTFGYSTSHFSYIFSTTFHIGLKEYLTILRCKHASNLLINNNCTVLDACLKSGFENIRTFYRNFKQVFGCTPSEYVKHNKKQ